MSTHAITAAEALARVPALHDERSVLLFEHGTLQVKLYAPRGVDQQTPHTRDELYVILQGSGEFVSDDERRPCAPGDFLFAAAGVAHRFENFTADFAVWVMFYGPASGEAPAV
jgi:mannose-6-phosphate isomerase-like protein (cupin superfamily)